MKRMIVGLLLGATAVAAACAKALPPLVYISNAQPGIEQKVNVAYYHIEELERKVSGLQDENNKRHADKRQDNIAKGEGKLAIRIADLEQRLAQTEKRAEGAAERDKAYQTRIDMLEQKAK